MDIRISNRKNLIKILSFTILICFFSVQSVALPVRQGAAGWGMNWAGQNYTIRTVSNTDDSGAGSFRQAIIDHNNGGGNSVIVFNTSGTIDISSYIDITAPYLIIAGQTAPSPGVEIKQDGSFNEALIRIIPNANYVMIQHLRFRPGDERCPTASNNIDCMDIIDTANTGIHDVVYDHCSFEWSVDELLAMGYLSAENVHDVTVRYCLFANGLHASCHPSGSQSVGIFVWNDPGQTNGPDNILFDKNLIAMCNDWMPGLRAENFIFVNNLVYGSRWRTMYIWNNGMEVPTIGSIVNNHYIADSDYRVGTVKPIVATGVGETGELLWTGSEIYVSGNTCDAGDSPCYSYSGGDDPFDDSSDPNSWPTGLAAQTLDVGDVRAHVLASVGARPLDRDTIDTDILDKVENETGSIINCVEKDAGNGDCDEVGEYAYVTRPILTANTQTLVPPGDPNGDSDEDGYTNLEEWLESYSDALEEEPGGGGSIGFQTIITTVTQ